MKNLIISNTMKSLFPLLISLFIITNIAKSQTYQPKPPYPILFVHGWGGYDQGWKKPEGNWKEQFESFGWTDGGVIDICLESSPNTLHDASSIDVSLIGDRVNTQPGDFYFINFHVYVCFNF